MMDTFRQSYELLARGGPMMLFLIVASFFALALIVERFLVLRTEKVLPHRFVNEVEPLIAQNKRSEALALARATDAPIARLVTAGLAAMEERESSRREALEHAGRRETGELERRLDHLGTIASSAPLLGLLGTVLGMIKAFSVIRVAGIGDPMKLSGGISEALISTAAGLVVGIAALIFQRFFLHRVDDLTMEMEAFAEKMLRSINRLQ